MHFRGLPAIFSLWAAMAIVIVVLPVSSLLRPSILVDDTFYALAAARHLAAGDGSTVDGAHRTNGYQPLWVWLLAGVTKVLRLDPIGTARAAVFLCAVATAGAGLLAIRLVRTLGGSETAAGWAAALWLLNPYLVKRQFNGLETALAACLLLAAAGAFVEAAPRRGAGQREGEAGGERRSDRWRGEGKVGLLAGLAGLARVDLLVLLPLLAARRMWRAAAMAAGLVAPWLVWSRLEFGSWVPLSGEATRIWYPIVRDATDIGPLLWNSAHVRFTALAALGLEWPAKALERLGAGGWTWLLVPAAAGAAAFMVGRRGKASISAWWRAARPLIPVIAAVMGFQWVSFALLYPAPWHLNRYFLPLHALLVVAAALFYDRAVKRRRGRLLWWSLWCASVLSGLIPYLWDTSEGRAPSLQLQVARWVREEAPPGARIGMLQSGVTGYFSGHEVINLDGKVNPGAMRALRDGRMADYLRREKIDLIGDWSDLVEAAIFGRAGTPALKRQAIRLRGDAWDPPFAFYRLPSE
jgi:hypothetical protein